MLGTMRGMQLAPCLSRTFTPNRGTQRHALPACHLPACPRPPCPATTNPSRAPNSSLLELHSPRTSSILCWYSLSSLGSGKVMAYTRCSGSRFTSPRQKARDMDVTPMALR